MSYFSRLIKTLNRLLDNFLNSYNGIDLEIFKFVIYSCLKNLEELENNLCANKPYIINKNKDLVKKNNADKKSYSDYTLLFISNNTEEKPYVAITWNYDSTPFLGTFKQAFPQLGIQAFDNTENYSLVLPPQRLFMETLVPIFRLTAKESKHKGILEEEITRNNNFCKQSPLGFLPLSQIQNSQDTFVLAGIPLKHILDSKLKLSMNCIILYGLNKKYFDLKDIMYSYIQQLCFHLLLIEGSHGDIKPDNIVITVNNDPTAGGNLLCSAFSECELNQLLINLQDMIDNNNIVFILQTEEDVKKDIKYLRDILYKKEDSLINLLQVKILRHAIFHLKFMEYSLYKRLQLMIDAVCPLNQTQARFIDCDRNSQVYTKGYELFIISKDNNLLSDLPDNLNEFYKTYSLTRLNDSYIFSLFDILYFYTLSDNSDNDNYHNDKDNGSVRYQFTHLMRTLSADEKKLCEKAKNSYLWNQWMFKKESVMQYRDIYALMITAFMMIKMQPRTPLRYQNSEYNAHTESFASLVKFFLEDSIGQAFFDVFFMREVSITIKLEFFKTLFENFAKEESHNQNIQVEIPDSNSQHTNRTKVRNL